ncbi:MAG: sensor domain-containing diguanylate cyclase [Deltaproteobacteria bacterium]|nr:sensor domain-containing diguanylate cyclase [Deltaproteobacteria bacterium]
MGSAPKPDFRIVLRAASLLNSSLDVGVVLRELLDGLDRLLCPTHWSLLLRDEATGELVFTLVRGEAQPQLLTRRLAPDEGIAGWVATQDEALLIPDVAHDPRFSARMDTLSGFRTRSVVAVPLRARARCIGVLEIVNALHERVFDATDLEILQSYADFAAIAIHNARTHEAIVEFAKNDPLTGLRNSQYFIRAIEEAIARGERFAIVFFDMDRFKRLVDTHGHVRGSAALAEVGRWLGGELAPGEVGCRFGGDEFALLFAGADRAAADARCRDLAARLQARTFLADEGIHATLGASFGAAAFPVDGDTPAALLHLADARMYVSKRARQMARGAD